MQIGHWPELMFLDHARNDRFIATHALSFNKTNSTVLSNVQQILQHIVIGWVRIQHNKGINKDTYVILASSFPTFSLSTAVKWGKPAKKEKHDEAYEISTR